MNLESMKRVREGLGGLLEKEMDDRIKIWAWVRLGGERCVDVAHRFGYKDGSMITYILRRLPLVAQNNPKILNQMLQIEKYVSRFKS